MAQELYNEFINFFKKHEIYDENTFAYIQENKVTFDYRDEEKRSQIGCYQTIRNGILTNITIYVPFINNTKTLLINIYINMHAIQLCKQLGKRINNNSNNEVLSMLYEKIYVRENPTEELEAYVKSLDNKTIESGTKKHKVALQVQDKLLKYQEEKKPTFKQMQKKARKLIRKHRTNNP